MAGKERPLRVIFVDRAGAQSIWSLMAAIAEDLLRGGHEPMFCVFDDERSPYGQPVPDGVEQVVIRVPPKRFLWDLYSQHRVYGQAFRELLRRFRPDVVHTNFCVPGIAARWIAAREEVPAVVSTQHELYGSMYPHYRWGLRLTEHCADAVVYVSKAVARSFSRDSLATVGRRTQHRVIPNGVDVEAIRRVSSGAGRRIPGKLVCAGRMVAVKGQETLVRALPRVIVAHTEVHLTLIGAGPDEERLRWLVHDLGLHEHVRFAGWLSREDTLREMATAQAVVIPSDGTQEGFGLVLVEAIVCGTPVVASDIPVFREVAGAADDAILWFLPGSVKALAAALITTFNANRADMNGSATSTRYKAEDDYNFARMTTAYIDLYDDLLQRKLKVESDGDAPTHQP